MMRDIYINSSLTPTKKLPESIESFKFVSHRADSMKDSHPSKFEQRLQTFVKLSFTELCDSKFSGCTFNNIVISLS